MLRCPSILFQSIKEANQTLIIRTINQHFKIEKIVLFSSYPAFLAVILGILASVSGLMNGFMLSPAGVIWTTMKDMITAAMSPMILRCV